MDIHNYENVLIYIPTYRKVARTRLSRLVAHPSIFTLFIKGKFDGYVLSLFAQRVQN